jgi:mycothiol synthase
VNPSVSSDVRVRRVGFRTGTESELAALHSIEIPIQSERGSDRMPMAISSYIAFAHSLPSQFNDHAWLAETTDGLPIAAGYCWSNAAGDPHVMECDVLVRVDRRREGLGSRLLGEICATAETEGGSSLTWSTYDAVPAGAAFSLRIGARVARVNRASELLLADVDWSMVHAWTLAGRPRELGYRLEMFEGPYPENLRADVVTFHHIMQTAPREDLDVGDVLLDTNDIAEMDRALGEAGRVRWTALVRDPRGACVGGTEVTFEPGDPAVLSQQNTGIASAHRNLGLARWAKAAMLERIHTDLPDATRVRTDNASSNAPMLAINDALGFKVTRTRTEWQSGVEDARRSVVS